FVSFFFFQAEDGIRDFHVTGVQTCALPISDMFVLVQISTRFDLRPLSARTFVARVRENVRRFYEQGVRFFEVHDEPNLTVQGYGTSWRSGEEFGDWFLDRKSTRLHSSHVKISYAVFYLE